MTTAETPPTALIVDDDPSIRSLLAHILGTEAYRCVLAADGVEARRYLAEQSFNVLLCDVMMPGETGLDLLRDVAGQLKETAILVVTALDDPDVANNAFDLGADAYIVKPFDPSQLLIGVASAVRRRERDRLRETQVRELEVKVLDRSIALREAMVRLEAVEPAQEPDGAPRDDCLTAEPPVRVVIVDDEELFAQSLARVLDRSEGIEVVGTPRSVSEADSTIAELRPDVVLADWRLPDGNGADVARAARREMPGAKVLILTGLADESVALAALEAGCAGYLTKHGASHEVAAAVRAAHKGESLVSMSMSMLGAFVGRRGRGQRGVGALTPREGEILRLVAEGRSTAAIAERLVLSRNTVRNHVQRVLAKLGAHSKLEAVATASRVGLLTRI